MDNIYIEKTVAKVAEKEGLKDFNIKIMPGKNKGDGFLGDIFIVQVEDTKNGKKLDLVIKASITDDFIVDNFHLKDIYDQELFFYSEMFPVIDNFQKENKLAHPFTAVAKYYDKIFEGKNRMLALENLRIKGFDLFDKKALVDRDHVVMVFTQYARFHAFSFAYRKRHPEEFAELTRSLKNIWRLLATTNKDFSQSFDSISQELSDVVKAEGNHELYEKFRKYEEGSGEIFQEVCVYEGKYSAILHGDCWSNNMMFKYKEVNGKKKLEDVCLIDWQLTNLGTPVYDLSYFLYSSASKEVYSNLDDLLRVYHDSLSTTLGEYGEDAEVLYPYSALKADWQKYCRFGFIMGLMLQRTKLVNNDEVIDLQDYANTEGEDKMQIFFKAGFEKEEYEKRSMNLIKHLYEMGAL